MYNINVNRTPKNLTLTQTITKCARSYKRAFAFIVAGSLAFANPAVADSYFSWLTQRASLPTFSWPSMSSLPTVSSLRARHTDAMRHFFENSGTVAASTALILGGPLVWILWKHKARAPQAVIPPGNAGVGVLGGNLGQQVDHQGETLGGNHGYAGTFRQDNNRSVFSPSTDPFELWWINNPWALAARNVPPAALNAQQALGDSNAHSDPLIQYALEGFSGRAPWLAGAGNPADTRANVPDDNRLGAKLFQGSSDWMKNVQKGFAGGWPSSTQSIIADQVNQRPSATTNNDAGGKKISSKSDSRSTTIMDSRVGVSDAVQTSKPFTNTTPSPSVDVNAPAMIFTPVSVPHTRTNDSYPLSSTVATYTSLSQCEGPEIALENPEGLSREIDEAEKLEDKEALARINRELANPKQAPAAPEIPGPLAFNDFQTRVVPLIATIAPIALADNHVFVKHDTSVTSQDQNGTPPSGVKRLIELKDTVASEVVKISNVDDYSISDFKLEGESLTPENEAQDNFVVVNGDLLPDADPTSWLAQLKTWWHGQLGGYPTTPEQKEFLKAEVDCYRVRPDFYYADERHKQQIPGAKKLILLCVHGTWSTNQSFGGNAEKFPTKCIQDFAKVLSHVNQCMVEIISYTWTGALNQVSREIAGKLMAHRISHIVQKDGAQSVAGIWSIAHSHGCNAINYAAKLLEKLNITIDTAIHLASPEPDLKALPEGNMPYNYKKLYHFYASMDFTQAVGSFEQHWRFSRKIPQRATKTGYVYNVRLQENGQHLNHVSIKGPALFNILGLIHGIETHYKDYFDLDANLFRDKQTDKDARYYPLMAIRHPEVCSAVMVDLENVQDFSELNKKIFKELYGRQLEEKPGIWQLLSMVYNELQSAAKKDFDT